MASSYVRDCEPIEVLSIKGGTNARATCSSCNGHVVWAVSNRPPPEQVRKHFKSAGWEIGRRVVCPQCLSSRKEKPIMATVPAPAKVHVLTSNSDAAKKNKRLVIAALEDYFDEGDKRYREGKSDDAIAKELNLAPAFVAMVREEFFGKLAEPSEVAELRSEVAGLTKSITAITERLASLILKNGWMT